ncbi:hypothetical protein BaOVIS_011490 [Babesia ovis]|uniref:Uncharacterized protein n=1 Tax=Babesia ovis TaxID=5869 RepID=A0A9W5WU95_BABOV|nr:hypothetical protein BaOVIS_011490 [Babesia ovis]
MGCMCSKEAETAPQVVAKANPAPSAASEPCPNPQELNEMLSGYDKISICGEQNPEPPLEEHTEGGGLNGDLHDKKDVIPADVEETKPAVDSTNIVVPEVDEKDELYNANSEFTKYEDKLENTDAALGTYIDPKDLPIDKYVTQVDEKEEQFLDISEIQEGQEPE